MPPPQSRTLRPPKVHGYHDLGPTRHTARPWGVRDPTSRHFIRIRSQTLHQHRHFHDYFVTHLPSSSLHPDSRSSTSTQSSSNPRSPSHKLPRDESSPHDATSTNTSGRSPASFQHAQRGQAPSIGAGMSREMTIVRIPLRSAKHHFGAHWTRGTRPYNEDAFQAGTIEVPAFAKKAPVSFSLGKGGRQRDSGTGSKAGGGEDTASKQKQEVGEQGDGTGTAAESESGDPQVFYFGVFDGHGGDTCSTFLRDKLHAYVEDAARAFAMPSTLQSANATSSERKNGEGAGGDTTDGSTSTTTPNASSTTLAKDLVNNWKATVGGYFKRFKPEYLPEPAGGLGKPLNAQIVRNTKLETEPKSSSVTEPFWNPAASSQSSASTSSQHHRAPASTIEQVMTYSFLRADLDFISQQLPTHSEARPSSLDDDADADNSDYDLPLGRHTHHSHTPFLGGSTSSLALISTPTPTPFWHPSTPLTLLTAHLGDTRILLSSTATGAAIPLTANHHPSNPTESTRLRRYAAAFTTDSFGEERFGSGDLALANTRAFGDMRAKRSGVTAEPEVKLVNLRPAEGSFLVLVSDGVSGVLSDQEVVDVVKEARTPEEGAGAVVQLAEELGVGEHGEADNATAVVVRLGGWERRGEGGGGSLGTRERREWRVREVRSGESGGRRGRM